MYNVTRILKIMVLWTSQQTADTECTLHHGFKFICYPLGKDNPLGQDGTTTSSFTSFAAVIKRRKMRLEDLQVLRLENIAAEDVLELQY